MSSNVAATARKLNSEFFSKTCVDLAKTLLGQTLTRKIDDKVLRGTIVETEAYLGSEDKAAHSSGGKRTERNKAMYMEPGTIYVYNIYGMYTCLNLSSEGKFLPAHKIF